MAATAKLRRLAAVAACLAAIGCDSDQSSAAVAPCEKRVAIAQAKQAGALPILPVLKGRVVDQANLLSPEVEDRLDRLSSEIEQRTSDQFVIVTLDSLDGRPIEDVGLALGRGWGVGQRGMDNGVLLVVAPNERRVRIEVGYGLDRILTDPKAAEIIERDLLPAFRRSDYVEGINDGAEAIRQVLVSQASVPRVGKCG